MAEHTPEIWTLDSDSDNSFWIWGVNDEIEVEVAIGPVPAAQADNLRLAAVAVNATAGIPTASLEQGVVADMREALEDCFALIEDMSRFIGVMALKDYQLFNEAPMKARAALSKAKGEG